MKKKILLIVPPVLVNKNNENFNLNFPTGLAYIAASLENSEYELFVLDAIAEKWKQKIEITGLPDKVHIGMTFDEIKKYVRNIEPDYVGITAMFTMQAENYNKVAEIIKSINNNIKIILGGAHATSQPEMILQNVNIDFIVLGEGENTILPLLNAIDTDQNLISIDGIAYKNEENKIVINPKTKFVDVNDLSVPARHLFPIEKYFEAGERHGISKNRKFRTLAILTSRGCPFNCNFCSAYQLFGKKYRYRLAENVLNEINDLVKKYQVEDIYFNDDQFLLNRSRIIEIFDNIINRNYNLTFDAPNGISPWLLDEEILIKMKKVGFWRISLAIESGNQWVLDNIIHKPVKLNKLPEIVRLIKKYNFEISAFLVVGNVGENAIESFSQMQDSFDLMRKLKITSITVSYLTPHKGSQSYDICKKRGYINTEFKTDNYNIPHISTPIWTINKLKHFIKVERFICKLKNPLLYWMLHKYLRLFGTRFKYYRYRILSSIISEYFKINKILKSQKINS